MRYLHVFLQFRLSMKEYIPIFVRRIALKRLALRQLASVLCWILTYPSESLTCNDNNVCFNLLSEMSDEICSNSLNLLSRSPYTSTAILSNFSSDQNGTVLTCRSTLALMPEPNEMANVTLLIQGTSQIMFFTK